MFENPRRGRQARNFTTKAPKILVLKSSSEQIFSRKLPLGAPDFSRVCLLVTRSIVCMNFHDLELWIHVFPDLAQRSLPPVWGNHDNKHRKDGGSARRITEWPWIMKLVLHVNIEFWTSHSWLCRCICVFALLKPEKGRTVEVIKTSPRFFRSVGRQLVVSIG